MTQTKPKPTDALRTPRPKKKLGLSVPPALRMPHDDLIVPRSDVVSQTTTDSVFTATMPSQTSQTTMPSHTSQTRHSKDSDDIKTIEEKEVTNNTETDATMTSQTSQTSQTSHSVTEVQLPISPTRDFSKVANSITRQAVPAGLFTGKSKQLYDCLYSLTRGAVVPTRSVRISRPKLMKKSGIGSRVTFDANIERLAAVGLLVVRQITGEHKGNEYIIFLPEEVSETMPSQTSQTSTPSLTGYAQKLDRLVSLETSQTRHSLSPEVSITSAEPKTSFKTIEKNDDDEAFASFTGLMRQVVSEVTGRTPAKFEKDRWRELAELLAAELKIAAARTDVSSVPAFLTEHLRRRLWKMDRKPGGERAERPEAQNVKNLSAAAISRCPDCGGTGFYYPQGYDGGVAKCMHPNATIEEVKERRLTDSEIIEQASIIRDLLDDGYTSEQAEKQFAASLHPQDWQKILERISDNESLRTGET